MMETLMQKEPLLALPMSSTLFLKPISDTVSSFLAHNAISNIRDRPLWMPSGVSHYQSRYFTNRRRAYDVESELNSLKRWLNEFETRISDKAAVAQSRPPPLHIGEQNRVLSIEGSAGRSGAAQGMSFLNDEEVVEI